MKISLEQGFFAQIVSVRQKLKTLKDTNSTTNKKLGVGLEVNQKIIIIGWFLL